MVPKWIKPTWGTQKLNVDVAVKKDVDFIGVGAIIRDDQGSACACLARKLVGVFSSDAAECLALFTGKHRGNMVAHLLASSNFSSSSDLYGCDAIPSFIREVVLADLAD
ncbi:hypothetical protein TIFTF001_004415 [Ficus carica]|uniref:RNase H type-1 domain-containing protein n=1 Tax=Ficus carica TaxID=3494 RepID=A0AA87ZG00_FICCA|nr:hypothetical protein TIFTF001_004415 [Ficus carica]